jgi:coatomer protein complex subunit alpha (xenin)
VAAVNFKPLKPLFLQCYQSAHVSVPANPSLPPLIYNIRRNPETTEMREVLPAIAFSLDDIKDGELAEANRFFSRGKFVESLAGFRAIIQKLLLVVAKDESEATDVSFPQILCFKNEKRKEECLMDRSKRWSRYAASTLSV